jgi:hypothetical protein
MKYKSSSLAILKMFYGIHLLFNFIPEFPSLYYYFSYKFINKYYFCMLFIFMLFIMFLGQDLCDQSDSSP